MNEQILVNQGYINFTSLNKKVYNFYNPTPTFGQFMKWIQIYDPTIDLVFKLNNTNR